MESDLARFFGISPEYLGPYIDEWSVHHKYIPPIAAPNSDMIPRISRNPCPSLYFSETCGRH